MAETFHVFPYLGNHGPQIAVLLLQTTELFWGHRFHLCCGTLQVDTQLSEQSSVLYAYSCFVIGQLWRGGACQLARQAIGLGPRPIGGPRGLTNIKQQQCQCIKFAMTGRDLPKWAPPDSTYSRSGVCLIALGENKGESHEQKKNRKRSYPSEVKKERRKKMKRRKKESRTVISWADNTITYYSI